MLTTSRESPAEKGSRRQIRLRGVAVHNLRNLDLDLPLGKLIAFCGVSGSGKTSLALDTLHTEGQRRYLESFSTHTRQFLERLEKPAAESITGLPSSIAVRARDYSKNSRSTVGSATELDDYFQLLFAKVARPFCAACERDVPAFSPVSAAEDFASADEGRRALVLVPAGVMHEGTSPEPEFIRLREQGYLRIVARGRLWTLDDPAQLAELVASSAAADFDPQLVVDRIATGAANAKRIGEAIEAAFRRHHAGCTILVAGEAPIFAHDPTRGVSTKLDGAVWRQIEYRREPRCAGCGAVFAQLSPKLFNPNSPLGACPACEGFGNRLEIDPALIVPDRSKSLRDGAIAPWNTPAYKHELDELLELAPEYDLPVDKPWSELSDAQRALVQNGVPAKKFGGLNGFFAWLERRKYKMHIRVFLSRWRSSSVCTACQGTRLNADALTYRVAGKNLPAWFAIKLSALPAELDALTAGNSTRGTAFSMLDQIRNRVGYLNEVGLGGLSLDRTLRTVSSGEAQRIMLTSALGSSLVNVLYVLDEPSAGLHPGEMPRIVGVLERLRDRGNTVIVVDHAEDVLHAADQLVEIGPGAGERGGTVVFQGTPAEILEQPGSATGDYLAGRRYRHVPRARRTPQHGWLRLSGASGHNLQHVTVDIPLGTLSVIAGPSASGKTTLLEGTLYPALCKRKKIDAPAPLPYEQLLGDRQIEDVIMIDQSPVGRSPRSNPATYLKIFDEIRKLFAETSDARTNNYGPGSFSFNVAGGRCETCEGDGFLKIDMQFMADVYMKCQSCQGRRFRAEILAIEYRNRNIADVLDMTAREAFTFFRGASHVQAKLKQLIDVGLEYLRLGQPANTLSSGESQRLKLAAYIAQMKKSRTLFLLDEPTTGLHFADVAQLLECFQALLDVGHSLVVVDHHPLILQAADYIMELGPGSADDGGRLIARGTPEELAANSSSPTGKFLKHWLTRSTNGAQ